MKFDLKENITKNIQESTLIDEYAAVYSEILQVDLELAKSIIQKKFERHSNTISEKFTSSIVNEAFKNIKPDKDIIVEEYLDKKPVIKG
jgi:hypothetical protein